MRIPVWTIREAFAIEGSAKGLPQANTNMSTRQSMSPRGLAANVMLWGECGGLRRRGERPEGL